MAEQQAIDGSLTFQLPPDVDPSGGVAVDPSGAYAFDYLDAKVRAFDAHGNERWSAGRRGDGPGEFARSPNMIRTGRSQWIAVNARIAVFDGRSVHRFDTTGKYLSSVNLDRAFTATLGASSRIRVFGDVTVIDATRTLFTSAGAQSTAAARTFTLYGVSDDSVRALITIPLPDLPRSPRGTIVDGLAQAKPSWDMAGACVVITDGSSESLIFGDLRAGTWDTVRYDLPDEFRDPQEANAATANVLSSGHDTPLPTARARVADIAIVGGGYLWLRPATRSVSASGEAIWQLRLSDGNVQRMMASAFPTVTSNVGKFGLRTDSAGHVSVVTSAIAR